MHDAASVAHQRGRVGRDEHLVVADAEHHGAAVARDDDGLRALGIEHGEAIRAGHQSQRRAHAVFERASPGMAAMRCASTSESVCDWNTTP